MPNYGNFEQQILDNLPKVARDIEGKLDLNNTAIKPTIVNNIDNTPSINPDYLFSDDIVGGRGTSMQRIRTDGQPHSETHNSDNFFDNITNNNASSFVVIVFSVIILILLLSFLTFEILKYIGI